ncbi:hypothetical protein LOK49_LG02G02787 [Camellia lanceoleosa]|uniref:Uncharacterized protein n=1 Tax=Camellia lanceoleosa TaxID=1840588 RepID=A0ACC0IM54_9ERIC|nr:hypothetical protein LOK49_LG02G02787 [Camellia lanceoleosa]
MSNISSRIRMDYWKIMSLGMVCMVFPVRSRRKVQGTRIGLIVVFGLLFAIQMDHMLVMNLYYFPGSHGEVKFDLSNARSGEFKTVGTGCSGYHSLDNGSHKHGGRQGLAHNVKDLDGSSIVSEGKLLKKGGSSGYGSHELGGMWGIWEGDSRTDSLLCFKRQKGKPEADVVVIGSGIAGLCCAGLLSRYQQDVLVLESHSLPGGAAHSFEKRATNSTLVHLCSPDSNQEVLDALGESIPCANYDSWMVYLPEGDFLSRIGQTEFFKDLEKYASLDAAREWRKLLDAILPMSAAAMALPPLSIRGDWGVLSTAATRYAPSLLKSFAQMGPQGALSATKLLRPFSEIVDSLELKEPFIRNWIGLLAFLLAGVKSNGIQSAEMVYMFAEWYKPGCSLEYPIHGIGAVVDALVHGLQKFGGRISFKSHVEILVVENGQAVGVKLRSGQFVCTKKAVVSNASMWDTLDLLPKEVIPKSYQERIKMTPQCESFMHLRLGFDAEGISEDLKIHHIVVNDWERGVDADQNVVLISIPSVLSPDLVPPGKHVLHAYMPGTEPSYYSLPIQVLWRAMERAVGPGFDHEKCEVKFLRRNIGTYGPAIQAGKSTFPGHSTLIPQLYCCSDSTFPGIGVPAVAASGAIVANSLVSVSQHLELLDTVGI